MLKLAMIALAGSRSVTAEKEYNDCHCEPDPHFRTFGGRRYDFHGGCPLVLVQSEFMDIHIETEVQIGYSSIKKVGLRMGEDDPIVIDKDTNPNDIPKTLDGYDFNYVDATQRYELILDDGQYVTVSTWNGLLSVMIHGLEGSFGDAEGMCGKWDNNDLLARNGNPIDTWSEINNGNVMGAEWRVGYGFEDIDMDGIDQARECDDPVFHTGGQWCKDNGCLCGEEEGENRGCDHTNECKNGKCIDEDAIENACAAVEDKDDKINCKFDVRMTGDIEFGKAPFYKKFIPPVHTPEKCDKSGKSDKSDKSDKSVKSAKSAKSAECDKSGKSDKAERLRRN